jgi:hypothetical protein
MACAESPEVLSAHGEARGVRGRLEMPRRGGQRRGGVGQQLSPHLRSLNAVRPEACGTCTGLEGLPADLGCALGGVATRPAAVANVV